MNFHLKITLCLRLSLMELFLLLASLSGESSLSTLISEGSLYGRPGILDSKLRSTGSREEKEGKGSIEFNPE